MNIIHSVLLLTFITIGLFSFITGLIVIVRRRTGWIFKTYLWALLTTEFVFVLFLIWDWLQLHLIIQVLYAALWLLGIYAVFRSFQAREKQAYRYTGWRTEFMEDVGFTLVFLFDVLAIVGAIELGMPAWVAAIIGPGSFFAGKLWLQYEKQRYMEDRRRRNERKLRKS